jgi:hypothetical protein
MKSANEICYPVFETNQILTSTQLNRLREFLDNEHRLTRLNIGGLGIVSGLEAEFTPASTLLTVSKGYGITSDGYFINIETGHLLKRFKNYTLPEGDVYEPFIKSKKQIVIYELFPESTKVEGTQPLSKLSKAELEKKAVVLFLEFFDERLNTCTGSDCDNKGKRRTCSVKILLINQNDLSTIDLNDYVNEEDKLETILLPTLNSYLKPKLLKDVFSLNEILSGYEDIVNEYRKKLSDVLSAAHKKYTGYLGLDDLDIKPVSQLKTLSFSKKSSQYAYDFIRDLILAYNEFRDTANYVYRETVYNKPVFPRHLMLAKVYSASGSNVENYRNYFVNTPFKDDLDVKTLQAQILFKRILAMIENFEADFRQKDVIKITPDTIASPLSIEAIPYYYKNANKIFKLWNAQFEIMNRSKENLSYNESLYNTSPVLPFVKNPLYFRYDDKQYYRIEGHLGMDYKEIVQKLEEQKRIFNLDFNIVALQAKALLAEIDLKKNCHLNEYQAVYSDLRKDFYCLVDNAVIAVEKDDDNERKTKIITMLLKLKLLLPFCVSDFNYESYWNDAKILIRGIIRYYLNLKHGKDKYVNEKHDVVTANELIRYQSLLDEKIDTLHKLIFSCFHKKIPELMVTLTQALEQHRKKHLSIFSNYVNRYPGAEHIAGVMKGGTFILLYDDNKNPEVFADFALNSSCCCECCEKDVCEEFKRQPFARTYIAETIIDQQIEIKLNSVDDLYQDENVIVEKIVPEGEKLRFIKKNKSFIYTPLKEFEGIDAFEYTIVDNESGLKSSALVVVLVRPEFKEHIKAVNDLAVTDKTKFIDIDVLANDRSYKTTGLFFDMNKKKTIITSLKARAEIIEKDKREVIRYSPVAEGADEFSYLLLDEQRKENSTAVVKVIVMCCEQQKECTLQDLILLVERNVKILIDFRESGIQENSVRFNFSLKLIEVIKEYKELMYEVIPTEEFWRIGSYTFDYTAFDLKAGRECTAKITLTTKASAPGKNIFLEREGLYTLLNSDKYKTAIATNESLSKNIEKIAGFYSTLETEMNSKPTSFISGSANTTVVEDTKKIVDPLITEIKKIDKEIAASGETTELKLRKEINLELLSNVTNTFLNTLAINEKDLAANSKAAIYLKDDLDAKIKSVEAGSPGVITGKLNVAAEPDKNNFNTIVSGLGKIN